MTTDISAILDLIDPTHKTYLAINENTVTLTQTMFCDIYATLGRPSYDELVDMFKLKPTERESKLREFIERINGKPQSSSVVDPYTFQINFLIDILHLEFQSLEDLMVFRITHL